MRRRHEHAAGRIDLEAEHGRRVQIGEENQHVVLLMIRLEVARSAPGSTVPAASAIPSRRRGVCGLLKIQSEKRLKASMSRVPLVGEAPDGDAADAVGAFRISFFQVT